MTDSRQTSQTSLEDIKEIDSIMQRFGNMLQRAKFEPSKNGMEECTDPGLPTAAKELLKVLALKEGKRYNILRIRGPNTTRIRNVYIVPIQGWGFDPMLDGVELKPKTLNFIAKGVEIKVVEGSISDLLILADVKE